MDERVYESKKLHSNKDFNAGFPLDKAEDAESFNRYKPPTMTETSQPTDPQKRSPCARFTAHFEESKISVKSF